MRVDEGVEWVDGYENEEGKGEKTQHNFK